MKSKQNYHCSCSILSHTRSRKTHYSTQHCSWLKMEIPFIDDDDYDDVDDYIRLRISVKINRKKESFVLDNAFLHLKNCIVDLLLNN